MKCINEILFLDDLAMDLPKPLPFVKLDEERDRIKDNCIWVTIVINANSEKDGRKIWNI